jgi:uncharacterized protein YjbI with pentapeptide repeats
MRCTVRCLLLFALITCSGCSDSEKAAGTEGGPCFDDGTCNEDLTCASGFCVHFTDAGRDMTGDAPPADAEQPDVAVPDTTQADTVQTDTAQTDTAQTDTAQTDTAQTDTAQTDATGDADPADAALSDANFTDAALADAALSDATAPDTGPICTPNCTGKECGDDGCGGSCGTCTVGCFQNTCFRKVVVISIYLDCDKCGDTWPFPSPDPYIRLTVASGQSNDSSHKTDTCNTLTYNWTAGALLPTELTSAKFEIWDYDSGADDLCVSWTGNFSNLGTHTLTGAKNSKLTYKVTM